MSEATQVLVVDIGTSSVRSSAVSEDGSSRFVKRRQVLPSSPAQGFVELDAAEIAEAALETAAACLDEAGEVAAVGIANQRASTVLWDAATSEPTGPGIGWQDLRTAGTCLMLRQEGIRLAPNQSATKLVALLAMAEGHQPENLRYGTLDSWIAWVLSEGELHVTDHTNAAVTGLVEPSATAYDVTVLDHLQIPPAVLPRIVSTSGVVGAASALRGAPPLAALVGDQQASLVGQNCLEPGRAKATFGTGGMLDCTTATGPAGAARLKNGCFPIVAWSEKERLTWGLEAVMLSAGSCVEWLRDDLGLLESAEESGALAASVSDTNGVFFVPALFGLGTPVWDFGARGLFTGITRGTTRAHLVRAVLEGVAMRGAELLAAAQADGAFSATSLSVDGGMSENSTFLQLLADACGLPVELAAETEATTLGAGFLAGTAAGLWPDLERAASHSRSRRRVEPEGHPDHDRWLEARHRAERAVPDLSELDF